MASRVIKSVAEMNTAAIEMLEQLGDAHLLLLYGELGSGKTTFVQALAKALGISERVTSPTFVIVSEYAVQNHPSIKTLVHVDLYRLEGEQVESDPAVRDVLERADDPLRLTVIEWADRLGENAPKTAQRISFEHGPTPTERTLTFS